MLLEFDIVENVHYNKYTEQVVLVDIYFNRLLSFHYKVLDNKVIKDEDLTW